MDDDRLDPQGDPFGFGQPANDERASPQNELGRPLPRSLVSHAAQESPYLGAPLHPRPRSRFGTIVRYSLTFGVAAALSLVLIFLLIQGPGGRDVQSTQNAGTSTAFTTRFRGEGEQQAKTAPALASADPGAAAVPRSPGVAARTSSDNLLAARPASPAATQAPAPNPVSPPPATSRPASPPAVPQAFDTRPPAPPSRAMARDEVDMLFRQGESFVAVGDFASARVVFGRAAEAGDVRAALALGATFDPILLSRMGARGITPDVAKAREWYARAREYGSPEAAERLQALANAR